MTASKSRAQHKHVCTMLRIHYAMAWLGPVQYSTASLANACRAHWKHRLTTKWMEKNARVVRVARVEPRQKRLKEAHSSSNVVYCVFCGYISQGQLAHSDPVTLFSFCLNVITDALVVSVWWALVDCYCRSSTFLVMPFLSVRAVGALCLRNKYSQRIMSDPMDFEFVLLHLQKKRKEDFMTYAIWLVRLDGSDGYVDCRIQHWSSFC